MTAVGRSSLRSQPSSLWKVRISSNGGHALVQRRRLRLGVLSRPVLIHSLSHPCLMRTAAAVYVTPNSFFSRVSWVCGVMLMFDVLCIVLNVNVKCLTFDN